MFTFNESIFKIENRGKWYNYIFTLNSGGDINLDDPLMLLSNSTSDESKLLLANDYNFKKSLFIFWRMIANNLDSNTWFRIGFKISLKLIKKKFEVSFMNFAIIPRPILVRYLSQLCCSILFGHIIFVSDRWECSLL